MAKGDPPKKVEPPVPIENPKPKPADDAPIGQTPSGEAIFEHPLAKSLHKDPKLHEHLVTLTGYPGRSSAIGYIRLYLHHDFQSYYEINQQDIRHCWPPVEDATTEPVNVSITASAQPKLVVHTTVTSAAAALLKGPMVSALLARSLEATISRPPDPTQPPPPPPHGVVFRKPTDGGHEWVE
jgi:hypothetical protein